MKSNDIVALRSKTIAELDTQLNELLAELAKARLKKGAQKLVNVHSITLLSDDVARVKIVLSAKRAHEAQQAE